MKTLMTASERIRWVCKSFIISVTGIDTKERSQRMSSSHLDSLKFSSGDSMYSKGSFMPRNISHSMTWSRLFLLSRPGPTLPSNCGNCHQTEELII